MKISALNNIRTVSHTPVFADKKNCNSFQNSPAENEYKPFAYSFVNFKGQDIKTEASLLNVKKILEEKIKNNEDLNEKDYKKIKPFFEIFNMQALITNENSNDTKKVLSILNSKINGDWFGEEIDFKTKLLDTINAVLAASNDKSIDRHISDYSFRVNNADVNKNLLPAYTKRSFQKLFDMCSEKGVFDLKFNKYGFPKTTDISEDEDLVMHSNVWVTDTMRAIPLIKEKYPEHYLSIMEKVSAFYKNETKEINRIIKDPNLYTQGYMKEGTGWQFFGAGHSFKPDTLSADRKFPAYRVESIGLYLERMSDVLTNDFKREDISDNMINTTAILPLYLYAVGFPQCKTCGVWENTLMESATSDTEITRAGLDKLYKILTSKDKKISKTAEKLEKSYKNYVKELGIKDAPKSLKTLLHNQITKADKRLKNKYKTEYECDNLNLSREKDAALSFVGATSVLDKNSTLDDVKKNLEIIENIKPLVGKNGIARYERDAYENANYELIMNSNDDFDFENIHKRWHMVDNPGSNALRNKAEWFMVSDISKSYGMQLKKMLQILKKENRKPTLEESQLIKECLKGQTEFINRAYGRITGLNLTKANGRKCNAFEVPESYMAVTSPDNINKPDKNVYLPGTNTPLAWAKSSLYEASKLMAENLSTLEELQLL